jgi:hypothetical protein
VEDVIDGGLLTGRAEILGTRLAWAWSHRQVSGFDAPLHDSGRGGLWRCQVTVGI